MTLPARGVAVGGLLADRRVAEELARRSELLEQACAAAWLGGTCGVMVRETGWLFEALPDERVPVGEVHFLPWRF